MYVLLRLSKLLSRSSRKPKKDSKKDDGIVPDSDLDDELYVERKRLENMELRSYITRHSFSSIHYLFEKMFIDKFLIPTFL